MKRLIDIGIIVTLAILFLASIVDAQRTSRITRPCPGSATPASVSIPTAGDIVFSPCSGRTAIKVLDPTTFITTATPPLFSLGTSATFPLSGNWIGHYQGFNSLGLSGDSKMFVARSNFARVLTTSATNSTFYLDLNSLDWHGSSNTTNDLYGYALSLNADSQFDEVVGISSGTIHGGPSAAGSNRLVAIQGLAGGSHGGLLNTAIAGEFGYSTTAGIAATTTNATVLRATATNRTLTVATDLRGLSFDGWSNTGTVTTSYGIYADSSIDLGATRWFIWSGSTSPSFLSGKLSFDATYTAGGTTGNRTINKPAFSVNFAAAASSLTVTNSFVTTASMLLCTVQTNDGTLKSVSAVAGVGSVLLTGNAAATGETKVYCEVRN